MRISKALVLWVDRLKEGAVIHFHCVGSIGNYRLIAPKNMLAASLLAGDGVKKIAVELPRPLEAREDKKNSLAFAWCDFYPESVFEEIPVCILAFCEAQGEVA